MEQKRRHNLKLTKVKKMKFNKEQRKDLDGIQTRTFRLEYEKEEGEEDK